MPSLSKIVVIGTSGSGKTTFARRLAKALEVPHFEMDAFHWEQNWTEADTEVFRARVKEATAHSNWVMDGNYGKVRDLAWGRADTLIWLDYSFRTVLSRILIRTLKRVFTKEELFGGNRESFRMSFFSKDSVILWMLQTYSRNRKSYPALLVQPEFAHLKVFRFQHPKETESFLKQFR